MNQPNTAMRITAMFFALGITASCAGCGSKKDPVANEGPLVRPGRLHFSSKGTVDKEGIYSVHGFYLTRKPGLKFELHIDGQIHDELELEFTKGEKVDYAMSAEGLAKGEHLREILVVDGERINRRAKKKFIIE